MNRKGSALVIALIVIIILVIAGTIWYYEAHSRGINLVSNTNIATSTATAVVGSGDNSSTPICDAIEIDSLGFGSNSNNTTPVIPASSTPSSLGLSDFAINNAVLSEDPQEGNGVSEIASTSKQDVWHYGVPTTTSLFPTPGVFGNDVYIAATDLGVPNAQGYYLNSSEWIYELNNTNGQFITRISLGNTSAGLTDSWNECGGYIYFTDGNEGGDAYEYALDRLNPIANSITAIASQKGGK